jgi:signal transduction histidine kinase
MDAIVRTAVEQFMPDATAQGVTVSLELGAGASPHDMPCDRERVLQIFRHLTTCALRVVPDNGTVAIRVLTDDSGFARFELEGKPPGEPHSRRIATEPSKPDLAIARGLVELHGGRLNVAGDENGLTLTFTLRAPSDAR